MQNMRMPRIIFELNAMKVACMHSYTCYRMKCRQKNSTAYIKQKGDFSILLNTETTESWNRFNQSEETTF